MYGDNILKFICCTMIFILTFFTQDVNFVEHNINESKDKIQSSFNCKKYSILRGNIDESLNNTMRCYEIIETKNDFIAYPQLVDSTEHSFLEINKMIINDVTMLLKIYPQETLSVKYEIKIANDAILSIAYYGDAYTSGNPYPVKVFFTTNIDLINSKKISLDDVVNLNEEFLEVLKDTSNDMDITVKNAIFSTSEADIIERLKNADHPELFGTKGYSEVYSYFTGDCIGIYYGLPHVLGDYAEFSCCW